LIFLDLSAYTCEMEGLTVAEISKALGIGPKTVKTRLTTAKIKPIAYAGPTGIYASDTIDKIRDVPARGRPRKDPA